jgi:hypothetical protein
MAKNTYISENTTQNQIDFMLMLDDNELDIFTLEEIKAIALLFGILFVKVVKY